MEHFVFDRSVFVVTEVKIEAVGAIKVNSLAVKVPSPVTPVGVPTVPGGSPPMAPPSDSMSGRGV